MGGGIVIDSRHFGCMPDGRDVTAYELEHDSGMRCEILDLGGIVTKLFAPDRRGSYADVVLGCDDVESCLQAPYFGALIGRFGNRIGGGRFSLDGVSYQLETNDGDNHLHGGVTGFDKVLWKAEASEGEEGPTLKLRYRSPDGDAHYPGNLDVEVVYTLIANGLRIAYEAVTDAPTIVNLTNHSYFNLDGHDAGSVLDHELRIDADRFTPVSAALIPTGELALVEGTPFDFRVQAPIGERVDRTDDEQIVRGGGIDHNFVLNAAGTFARSAKVYAPVSGRTLEVWTDQLGVQIYTGNFLDGSVVGKGGTAYPKRAAICLETQHFPDAPNQPAFPSVVLRPGETYCTTTEYRFG